MILFKKNIKKNSTTFQNFRHKKCLDEKTEEHNSATPVRVLHVVHSLLYGGIETYVLNVLRYMERNLVQGDVCTVGRDRGIRTGEAEQSGARVLSCPLRSKLLGLPISVRRPYKFIRKLTAVIKQGNYDIVHSYINFMNGFIMRAADLAETPVRIAHACTILDWSRVTLLRNLFPIWMRYWIRRHSTHMIGDSKPAMNTLYGVDWQNDPKCQLHYCGINLDSFSNNEVNRTKVRRELGLPDDVPVIGHVGRISEPKNHKFLVDVFAEFVSLHPEAYLLLVGDGPMRPMIETYVHEIGLWDRVIFTGVKKNVSELMLAMDIFVFPSLYDSLPQAVIEAQVSGLRCLISECISEEAAAIPDAVYYLSLNLGPKIWAQVVETLLQKGRIQPFEVQPYISSPLLSAKHSVALLQKLYINALKTAHLRGK